MKAVAFTLYVVAVLLISGFARAHADTLTTDSTEAQYQSSIPLTDAVYEGKGLLKVSGDLPNHCYGQPSVTMTQDSQNQGTLVVRVSSPRPTGICESTIKEFVVSVQLPILTEAAKVRVDRNAIYTLKVEGTKFEQQISGRDLN